MSQEHDDSQPTDQSEPTADAPTDIASLTERAREMLERVTDGETPGLSGKIVGAATGGIAAAAAGETTEPVRSARDLFAELDAKRDESATRASDLFDAPSPREVDEPVVAEELAEVEEVAAAEPVEIEEVAAEEPAEAEEVAAEEPAEADEPTSDLADLGSEHRLGSLASGVSNKVADAVGTGLSDPNSGGLIASASGITDAAAPIVDEPAGIELPPLADAPPEIDLPSFTDETPPLEPHGFDSPPPEFYSDEPDPSVAVTAADDLPYGLDDSFEPSAAAAGAFATPMVPPGADDPQFPFLGTDEDPVFVPPEPTATNNAQATIPPPAPPTVRDDALIDDEEGEPDESLLAGSRRLLPLLFVAVILLGLVLLFGPGLWGSDGDEDERSNTNTDVEEVIDATLTATTDPTLLEPDETGETANLWDELDATGEASAFVALARSLDVDLDQMQGVLFAPSDEAIAALSDDTIDALRNDPAAAAALLDYHTATDRLTSSDLVAADGVSVRSNSGLPIYIAVEGDDIVLNGESRVSSANVGVGSGVAHVIDTVLVPPTVNDVINLEPIEFEVNAAVLTSASRTELNKAVQFFNENPSITAEIHGHTDTDGNAEPNLQLSEERAEAVSQFLVEEGISADRLTPLGFGETEPVLVNGVEDKTASRRIEFIVR